ncbi:MAG TPA: GTP-binding protein, partial [Anaerolineales bacterium]|nr:GTP-binding protein [Anaerolineales bacterium]
MTFLNLGILAHVDAGKTSLTERLLFRTGVIRKLGSVDAGTTQTDTLALEQQRGITIKSAVATFALDDVVVNLLDTPGHPDFIAEVERVLGVLDGAVLVISAVEGVQAQTRVLFKALQRLRVPTLFFINKIDRRGAQEEALLQRIAEKLTPAILPLGATQGRGTSAAAYLPFEHDDPAHRARLIDALTARDDAFLAACLRDDMDVAPEALRRELAAQTRRAQIHPVVFGSAITGAGVDELLAAIRELLPTSPERAAEPVAGSVFKIERGRGGEKVAYVRLTAGALRVRDRVGYGAGHVGRVTGLAVFGPQGEPGGAV